MQIYLSQQVTDKKKLTRVGRSKNVLKQAGVVHDIKLIVYTPIVHVIYSYHAQ